jgi:mycothiol synthase
VAVEEIDAIAAPDAVLLAIHEVEEACADDLAPGEPWRSATEAIAYMRNPPRAESRRRWVARLDGEIVGTAGLFLHGPSLAYAQVRVRPDARRQGIGTLLVDELRAAAREARAGSMFVHHATAVGAAFAAHIGAIDDQRDIRSVLWLKGREAAPVAVPSGYRLRSWVGASPDDLAASYALARNAISDAPQPSGQVEPGWTIERVRDLEDAVGRRRRDMRVTALLDDADRVVSFTELRVSAPPATVASTEDTATVPDRRGLGLALAVKAESLRLLRADRPDVELVTTTNAEQNAAMRALNAKLGFEPVATLTAAILAP